MLLDKEGLYITRTFSTSCTCSIAKLCDAPRAVNAVIHPAGLYRARIPKKICRRGDVLKERTQLGTFISPDGQRKDRSCQLPN